MQFGEIYFTTHLSRRGQGMRTSTLEMTLNYACIFGRIKLVSSTTARAHRRRERCRNFLGPDNYSLVVIPPERLERR